MSESAVKAKKHKRKLEKNYYGYLFTAPFIIGFLLFSFYPLFYTFYMSITDQTLMNSGSYNIVGLKNFKNLFTNDPLFMTAFWNTWKIWLLNFVPQIGAALLLAVWFTNNRLKLKGVGVFRTLYFLPNLLMPVTVAALFFNFFSVYGPVNQILSMKFEYFRSTGWSVGIVAFIQWWLWFGQTIIIMMAGMSSISPSFYESAMVDGATARQMFTKITLPNLKPILVYTLVTSLVGGMQMFDIPYMISGGTGAPSNSILTIQMLMYNKFSSHKGNIAIAGAIGVFLFVVTSIVALVIMRLLRDRDPEGIGRANVRERRKYRKGAARV